MEQFTFAEAPRIVNASEPHMALLFLLDTSGSMEDARGDYYGKLKPINELNSAINRFKGSVCEDSQTRDILDVAIINFDDDYTVLQEFTPVEEMKTINLTSGGMTNLGNALNKAVDMVEERSRFYRRMGTEPYKPWIVIISDGGPTDDITAVTARVNELVSQEKLAVWALSVPGANNAVLHQICGQRVLNLEGYDFKGFLDWANKSMRAVSRSAPGEKAKGQELPSTVTIDSLM